VATPSRIMLERGYHAANKRFYPGGHGDGRIAVRGISHFAPRACRTATRDAAGTSVASRLSLCQIPAVDYQFCARDEAGFVTRKKETPVCKLLRLRHTLKWRGRDYGVADAFWLLIQHHRSSDDTWMNGIHPDSISSVGYGSILGQIANGTFGCMVGRRAGNRGNAPDGREIDIDPRRRVRMWGITSRIPRKTPSGSQRLLDSSQPRIPDRSPPVSRQFRRY